MKLASVIEGLAVIGVKEGAEIAAVDCLVVSPESKKVEYLCVENDSCGIMPCLIKYSEVIGVGKDFIMVPSADCIKKASATPELTAAADSGLVLPGSTVIFMSGDLSDAIEDYEVDEKSGVIENIILAGGQKVAGSKLVTLSPSFVLVAADGYAPAPAPVDDETSAFLLGKTLQNSVTSEDGSFSVSAGTVITEEIIAEAQRKDMLLVLTMEV